MSHLSKGSLHEQHIFAHDDEEEDEPVPQVIDRDPTGRFERYAICLGKGAFKTVYKAFDQEEGVEVAWNQLRVDHLSAKDASKFKAEVELLSSLRHPNIIQLYHSWSAPNANGHEVVFFITELMTSGTLKKYLKKATGTIRPKFLKTVCVQILKALVYLHTRNPPVLHRDLKCENIFVNGNTGEVKLGDLGLATVKQMRHVTSVIGTPEFMAPELYDERYDEKVDIYAFGMCVLEMVTKEYPYSECSNQAQIYKRVTSGIKPEALLKIEDPILRGIVESCLDFNPENRSSADQLLMHPFFKIGDSPTPKLGPQDTTVVLGSSPDTGFKPSTGSQFALPPTVAKSDSSDAQGLHPLVRVPTSNSHTVPLTSSMSSDPRLPPSLSAMIHPHMMHMDGTMSAHQTLHGAHFPSMSLPVGSVAHLSQISLGSGTIGVTNTSPVHAAPNQATMFGTPPDQIKLQRQASELAVPSVHGNVELVSNDGKTTLQLRMVCRVPGTTKNQKVLFPFALDSDTPEEVVGEMIKEEVLEEEDRELAVKNIQRIVRKATGLDVDDDAQEALLQLSPKKMPRGVSQVMQDRMGTPSPRTPTSGTFANPARVKSPPIAPMALPSAMGGRLSGEMERPLSSNSIGHDRTLSDPMALHGIPARNAAAREIFAHTDVAGGHRRSSSQNSISSITKDNPPPSFSRGTSSGHLRIREEEGEGGDEHMMRSLYGVIGESSRPMDHDLTNGLSHSPNTPIPGMVRMARNDSLISSEGAQKERSRSSTLESREFGDWMVPLTDTVQPVVIGKPTSRRGSIHNRRVGEALQLNGIPPSHPMMPRGTQSTSNESSYSTVIASMDASLPSPAFSQHQHTASLASLPTLQMELEDVHENASTPGIMDYDEEELTNVLEGDPELMRLWEKQKRESEEMARYHAEEWGRVMLLLKEKRKARQELLTHAEQS